MSYPSGPADCEPHVLLVDDVPGEAANFRLAFADRLTAVRNLAELDVELSRRQTAASGCPPWDLAFVDFQLSDPEATGLSAALRLRVHSPTTTIVTYSQLAENGRLLFAAGARHWFGASAVLDKSQNHPQSLCRYARSLAAGIDPSPLQWRTRLQASHLIDALLPDLVWVERWRALDRFSGDVNAAAESLNLRAAHLRGFRERATAAVNQINEALFGLPHRGSRNLKGILGTFVARHHSFLTAPDLAAVLAYREGLGAPE